MHENAEEASENDAELPAIDFQSPGRFMVHNPLPEQTEAPCEEAAPFKLGEHDHLERFTTLEAARSHALALMQQARRSLCLYSPDLEPWLYHNSATQQACAHLLTSGTRCQLRILVRDLSRAVKEGHRLLHLNQRLSSNFQIRRINPAHPSEELAYLIADNRGLLVRPEPEQFAGYALYNDPGKARLQQTRFDQAWDLSITDPDLRSFLL